MITHGAKGSRRAGLAARGADGAGWGRTLLAAALAATVSAILVQLSMPGARADAATDPALVADDPSSRSDIESLARRIDAIENRLSEMRVAAIRGPVDGGEIDLAKLAERLRASGYLGPAAGGEGAAAAGSAFDPDATLARLLGLKAGPEADAVWEEVRSAGKIDEMVEAFERFAESNPGSADARVDLGLAYVQKLLSASDGAEKTRIGKQADEAFTRALELDPNNWRARFRKAEGLSYWPAVSGKQAEAIEHFEILVRQQERMPATAEQAQTYLYLGNLYERSGQHEKAAEIWAKGLARHPVDPELRRRAAGGK